MQQHQFMSFLSRIYGRFNMKVPSAQDTLMDWYEDVKHVPDEALRYAENQIKDLDSLPRNLVKTMKAMYHSFRQQNPAKFIHVTERCPDCNGNGLIWLRRFDGDAEQFYTCVARCGNCQNWRRHFSDLVDIPVVTARRLVAYSVRFKSAPPMASGNRSKRSVQGLTAQQLAEEAMKPF